MKELYSKLRDKWIKSKTVHEVYAARWIWYHTLLALLMGLADLLLLGILLVLAIKF